MAGCEDTIAYCTCGTQLKYDGHYVNYAGKLAPSYEPCAHCMEKQRLDMLDTVFVMGRRGGKNWH